MNPNSAEASEDRGRKCEQHDALSGLTSPTGRRSRILRLRRGAFHRYARRGAVLSWSADPRRLFFAAGVMLHMVVWLAVFLTSLIAGRPYDAVFSAASAAALTVVLVHYSRTGFPHIAARFLAAVLLAGIGFRLTFGGEPGYGVTLALLMAFPPIVFRTLGVREGWMWISASFAVVIAVSVLEPNHPHGQPTRVHLIAVYVFVAAVALLMEVTRYRTEQRLCEKNRKLDEALKHVRTLKGLLPICASCKRIREQDGDWVKIEAYIQEHTEARFSHSLCPECTALLYPDRKP